MLFRINQINCKRGALSFRSKLRHNWIVPRRLDRRTVVRTVQSSMQRLCQKDRAPRSQWIGFIQRSSGLRYSILSKGLATRRNVLLLLFKYSYLLHSVQFFEPMQLKFEYSYPLFCSVCFIRIDLINILINVKMFLSIV